MYIVVDRIEENFVVCFDDNETLHTLNLCDMKFDVSEGDVLNVEFNGENIVLIEKDEVETCKRKVYIESLQKKLFNK